MSGLRGGRKPRIYENQVHPSSRKEWSQRNHHHHQQLNTQNNLFPKLSLITCRYPIKAFNGWMRTLLSPIDLGRFKGQVGWRWHSRPKHDQPVDRSDLWNVLHVSSGVGVEVGAVQPKKTGRRPDDQSDSRSVLHVSLVNGNSVQKDRKPGRLIIS